MSEVSREERIKVINNYIECKNEEHKNCLSGKCEDCEHNYSVDEFDIALVSAISAMKKLQKIEKIYKEYNILCSECPADRERGECNDCFVYNVEKVFER